VQIKTVWFALLAAGLSAFCTGGCGSGGGGSGPTMPGGPDTYTLSAAMKSVSGDLTIGEVTIRLDGFTVADSCLRYLEPIYDAAGDVIGYGCGAPASAAVSFSAGGSIGPGSHTLTFFMVAQAVAPPTTYTVPAFNLVVKGPDGKPLKTISLPAQTASIGDGGSIVYGFSL
jgi:hypothetical protein